MTRRRATLALTACAALTGLAMGGLPTSQAAVVRSAHESRLLQGAGSGDFPGAEVPVGDVDRRGARLAPLAAAKAGIREMGAGMQVSWTQYGTPLSLTREKGFLATGLAGTPAQVAREYLRRHAAIWGLTAADVDALQIVINAPLPESKNAYSVTFNQVVSGVLLAEDGYVDVGVVDGKVAIVTSSLVPTKVLGTLASTTPKLTVQQAVLAAAKDAGVTGLKTADLTVAKKLVSGGFVAVTAKGLHQKQLARVRAIATTHNGVRLVWETDIQDVAGGRALATMSFVDAVTGSVLLRRDAVDTLADSTRANASQRSVVLPQAAASAAGQGTIGGTYSKSCSAKIALTFAPGDRTVVVSAAATSNPSDDITINILRNGVIVANGDTGASPEAATASFNPGLLATDKLEAQVCPFDGSTETGPQTFQGVYLTSPAAVPGLNLPTPPLNGSTTGPATFRAFGSNPQLARDGVVSKDDRYLACSGTGKEGNPLAKDLSACSYVYRDNSRLDYDADPVLGAAGATTFGNNALTTNAQASSSLTPGAPATSPVSLTREYAPTFNDAWHVARCNPASILPPDSANIDASIVNLFVGHNRIHDFSYRLGLTEVRGAMQVNNFGHTGTNVAEDDPEIGNAQNAALTNNAFAVSNLATGPAAGVGLTGRDNANQITLQDGVPGITNQYLFQPVVGFYAPCTDGDLDATVFLHEYTHAISNRLIAGPATGLSGQQGGSMGESWSDLDAIEYLNAFGLAGNRGEDPFSLGAYATGDPLVGIRDYNLAPSRNPLNYSDFGFDATGAEVHADGEVWNAVQMTVREALIKKYDATFPHTNKVLQKACALGRTASGAVASGFTGCPGNRHYITYLYDAMILQANGAPSMVDMKNAELAAVMMRLPADYDTVADAFASRGLGSGASSKTGDDKEPIPSFASPKTAKNGHVTFKLVDANTGKPVAGAVYIGMYTARCRPVATSASPKAEILKGSYALTVQAKGYGIQRFTKSFAAGSQTVTLKLAKNVASSAYGAAISGNAGALRIGRIIDDSEVTNGAYDGQPVKGRTFTVKFGGGLKTFDKVALSALHHPALPAKGEDAAEFQGRLLGIHTFDLQASSNGGASFTTIYSSPSNFFPTGRPRATAPDLILRTVKLSKPVRANALRLVIKSNTCTGSADFNHEQEDDVTNPSDCRSTATNTTRVTVTELQAFAAANSVGAITPIVNPPVVVRPGVTHLAATGSSTSLALGGMLLLGLGGVVLVLRRRAL